MYDRILEYTIKQLNRSATPSIMALGFLSFYLGFKRRPQDQIENFYYGSQYFSFLQYYGWLVAFTFGIGVSVWLVFDIADNYGSITFAHPKLEAFGTTIPILMRWRVGKLLSFLVVISPIIPALCLLFTVLICCQPNTFGWMLWLTAFGVVLCFPLQFFWALCFVKYHYIISDAMVGVVAYGSPGDWVYLSVDTWITKENADYFTDEVYQKITRPNNPGLVERNTQDFLRQAEFLRNTHPELFSKPRDPATYSQLVKNMDLLAKEYLWADQQLEHRELRRFMRAVYNYRP